MGVDIPPHRRRVGLVFQSYALFPHMTALGNVAAAMGHSIVMVTHDLAEAEALADRICVLDAGVTLLSGTPTEILHGVVDAKVREALDLPKAP